jgi:hypothetical protein
VLANSNGKNADTWCSNSYSYNFKALHKAGRRTFTITANVWISILVFVAGKAMAFLFAEAVTTAWWVSAMEGGTLKELHHNWEAGKSIAGVLKNPRMFNIICLGSVAFTCFAGLGTVFQKATSVVTGEENTFPEMSAFVAVQFPAGWSGTLVTDADSITPSAALSAIMKDHSQNKDIVLDVDLCKADNKTTCNLLLPALGFQYDCHFGDMGFDVNLEPDAAALFSAAFIWGDSDIPYLSEISPWQIADWNPWTAKLDVTFKTTPDDANTTKKYRNCTLTPAIVNYPIQITNKIATLKAPTGTPNWAGADSQVIASQNLNVFVDEVNQTLKYPLSLDYEVDTRYKMNVTVGALYMALESMFGMSVVFNTGRESSIQYGAYTSTYLKDPAPDNQVDVATTWSDPLPDVALRVRDFMFRTAIALAANKIPSDVGEHDGPLGMESYQPTYTTYAQSTAMDSHMIRIIPVYKTNFTFAWIGFALMLGSIAATIPLFYGFWRLGRKVSLSPLEMAKAMNVVGNGSNEGNTANDARNVFVTDDAGMGGSNAEMKGLLTRFGDRQVRYGQVAPQTLGFSFKERVRRPMAGEVYL